jgi:hypothetical protein
MRKKRRGQHPRRFGTEQSYSTRRFDIDLLRPHFNDPLALAPKAPLLRVNQDVWQMRSIRSAEGGLNTQFSMAGNQS